MDYCKLYDKKCMVENMRHWDGRNWQETGRGKNRTTVGGDKRSSEKEGVTQRQWEQTGRAGLQNSSLGPS